MMNVINLFAGIFNVQREYVSAADAHVPVQLLRFQQSAEIKQPTIYD